MKAITVDQNMAELRGAGEIPISPSLRETLRMGSNRDYQILFKNLRLDLQSRILSLDDRDLVKLQGKLEYLDELDNFFTNLLK